ncbi:DnaJ homolog subfamily B member 13-like protein [Tanacetum coccineum]
MKEVVQEKKNKWSSSLEMKSLDAPLLLQTWFADEEVNANANGNGDEKDGVTSPKVTIPRISRTASTGFLPSSLPKSMSQRRSKTPDCIRPVNSLLRSLSTKSMDSNYFNGAPSLSRRNSSTIVYSNANGLQKPPDMVKRLDCTLEELFFGCIKKVNINMMYLRLELALARLGTEWSQSRCVLPLITSSDPCFNVKQHLSVESSVVSLLLFFGRLVGGLLLFLFFKRKSRSHPKDTEAISGVDKKCEVSHSIPTSRLKGQKPWLPGWKKGTKRNAIFKRNGDDLEVSVEFPLVDALTGCALAIPSLGGLELCLMIDERITPGYKKTLKDRA